MNDYQRALMNAPNIESRLCPFCGQPATNRHHIVPRSQGGEHFPTVTVCGMGNASGCHRLLHLHRINLRYDGERWLYLITRESVKEADALNMDGWRELIIYES